MPRVLRKVARRRAAGTPAGQGPDLQGPGRLPDKRGERSRHPLNPDPGSLGFLIHGFGAGQKSWMFGVWAAPKIGDFWPAQKPCITNPSVHRVYSKTRVDPRDPTCPGTTPRPKQAGAPTTRKHGSFQTPCGSGRDPRGSRDSETRRPRAVVSPREQVRCASDLRLELAIIDFRAQPG